MRRTACLGLLLMLLAASAAPGFAQDIKDPTEYKAYMDNVYNEKDLAKKAAGGEKFLNDYPKTDARNQTYMQILLSYAQIPNWVKALETADKQAQMAPNLGAEDKNRVLLIGMTAAEQAKNTAKLQEYAEKVLAVDPKNPGALVTMSNLLANSVPKEESKQEAHFAKTLEITRRALAAPKPAGATDAQWNPVVLQLHHTVCLVLLNQKKYTESIAECKAALAIDKKDGYAWYLIGLNLKPGFIEASRKYKEAVDNYNANRDKDKITVDDLKAASDGALQAAETKQDELVDALARAVAAGGSAAAEARKELKQVFTGTDDELNRIVSDKKIEIGAN